MTLGLLADNPAAAEERYRKVLSHDEGNLKALLALAVLANHAGRADEAEKWLKQAHRHHPQATQAALMLVDHYQRQGKTLKALDMARKTAITHPRDQQVLKTLALAQFKAGEDKAALTTLRSLVEVAPQSPEAHFKLALVQLKLKKSDAARKSLQQALELRADYPAAQFSLGRLELVGKNFDAALDIANSLKQAHPEAFYGYELEGDIFYSRQAFKQAAGAYALAAGKASSAPLTRKLFQSRLKAGEQDAAYEALRQWLDEHPQDARLRTMLATALLSAGQPQSAIEEYLKVLEYDADNVTALNNLASLYQEAGNPEGVKYAERAHELVPERPDVSDTLGWLLVQNGEINRGLVLLQEAAVKAPHIPEIRYHMIVALDKAGRRDEARKELDRLLKTGKTFPDVDKARALHEQWGG